MLDIILHKSYLHWILNSPTKQRNEEIITSLISVDVCFNRRITRKRFKKAIGRYLKDIYRKTKKRSAIIRNNRNYLLDNIQPNDELIATLLSHNCITEEQSQFIQRQRAKRYKNEKILFVMESLDERSFSKFLKCLRQTNQKTVAKIVDDGGAIIKVQMPTPQAKCTTSMETQLLLRQIEDLRNTMKPRSLQTEEESIDILNIHLDRQSLVVWMCCRTQAALEHVQKLYESNQLRRMLFERIPIQPPTCGSMVINIDENQFKKTVVVCPISINFSQSFELGGHERNLSLWGVTKLQNEIFVLCKSSYPASNVIRVFEDLTPFHLLKDIEIKEIQYAWDIGSSEKDNCLYISEFKEECVWKITRETDNQYKIIKWLTTHHMAQTMSVTSDGQLLMINSLSNNPFSYSLMIYGSDAELIRSIPLPIDMSLPSHAVETSIGNFLVLHFEEKEIVMEEWKHKEWSKSIELQSGSNFRRKELLLIVSELTRDGQLVIRRRVPSNEPREPARPNNYGYYLSLASDDRVFVADTDMPNHRAILLDTDLNVILYSAKEAKIDKTIQRPFRLFYDKEKKQLIVGHLSGDTVNVHTLHRN